jgi:hypothetical protein
VVQGADEEIEDGRFGELVGCGAATDGGADDSEDAGADDSADAESGERDRAESLPKCVLGALGVADQLVDGLGGEDLARLRCGVAALGCGRQGVRSSLEEELVDR